MKHISLLFLLAICFTQSGCQQTESVGSPKDHNVQKNDYTHTNKLIDQSSPYLLQHAHNPVDWYPWGEEALQKARSENKMLLVSIGYSACHWCHVMEKESFEDEQVAEYMNAHFVCIKVDREERPDVDQVYMDAVQVITGRGGWPLNCFALPDGKPFYGGTYFTKKNWLYLLQNVVEEYESDPEKLREYADELIKGISRLNLAPDKENEDGSSVLSEMMANWKKNFDQVEGGANKAPKFPLPNNYQFLLDYAILNGDQDLLQHVKLTLDKMALGGIYDQIGGGFARYSTDELWKVPHFEKMLYDNAQLISLYANAYRYFGSELYKRVVEQSCEFIQRELTGPEGEFYSALDADSEGEEGKFYVWTRAELQLIEGLDMDFLKDVYRLENRYTWEGKFILHRNEDESLIWKKYGLTAKEFYEKLDLQNDLLLSARSKRVRPGLDDKSLTAWSALMITAYVDAYKALGNKDYLERAAKSAKHLDKKLFIESKEGSSLYRNYKKGKISISGFLEDYAFLIQAYTDLYEVSFEDRWLDKADQLNDLCSKNFWSQENDFYYFTSTTEKSLVVRKIDVHDNVIPSANSVMALNHFRIGTLKDRTEELDRAKLMLNRIKPSMASYGSAFSNWAILLNHFSFPFYEVAISGKECHEKNMTMQQSYLPNTLFLGAEGEGRLPLLQNKYVKGKTVIYVCVDHACKLPVEDSGEALKQIEKR